MSEFPVNEPMDTPQSPAETPSENAAAETAAADAFAKENVDFAQRLAAAAEQMKAAVAAEEAPAEEACAEAAAKEDASVRQEGEVPAAEESPAEEAAAEETPVEETPMEETPVEEVTSAKPAYAMPAPAKKNSRNPGGVWGIIIGVTLGALCCACIAMLAGLAVSAGRGVIRPAPGAQQNQQSQQQTPADPDASLQVHEVPREEDGFTTQYIADQVRDSVVGILIYDGFGLEAAGGGTGIVMSEDGYIITNAHVVVDATGLTVVMHDESRYTARVVGYDEKTDLAVIKINATGLKPAEFGDSDAVVVGEKAVAIGNPGGLAGSVSQGIISGLNREITITLSDNTVASMNVIQTDAAINPGNSGGPLLNAWGQVIGINSSKIVASGYEGIGFSIPVNEAKPIIDNLIQYGYVKDRAVLGISVIALDATNGPANGLPSQGLYIASIAEYSDMLNHGIEPGDVILKANGREMITTDDLTEELKSFRPGDTIRMEILHSYNNNVITVDVLLKDSKAGE
ncbi:MAG: trypsin-like peptidase domain-containing protein [Oscillospiraceae bacterium]|nr:trypsin-like peptidase domain-containing protein [Oscillospiraceae bacterium]